MPDYCLTDLGNVQYTVVADQCTGGKNQRWIVSGDEIKNVYGKCLDSSSDNEHFYVVDCDGASDQKWLF